MEQLNIPGAKMKHNRLLLFGTIMIVSFAIMGNIRATTYYCDSCASCRGQLDDNLTSGDTLELTANIAADDDDCVYGLDIENITIDCDNYYINNGGTWEYGITLEGIISNITIKDCYTKSDVSPSTTARINSTNNNFECDSYPTCSFALGIAQYGNTVYFVGNYVSTGYDGFYAGDWGNWDSGVTFDCLGNNIPGYVRIENNNSTLKNCVISSYSPQSVTLDDLSDCLILNNTFRDQASQRTIYFGSSNSNRIINNTFEEHQGVMLYAFIYFDGGDSISNIFYGNIFNATNESYYAYCADNPYCIGDYQSWNTTTYGNAWLFNNGSGFSETCIDSNNNGICDSPYMFSWDEGEEIYGVTDYLPLFFGEEEEIIETIELTINEPQNISYYEGNLIYNVTTNITANSICLSTDGNLTYPICSYNVSMLYGTINMTPGFYNWTFRANNSNTVYDTVFFTINETPGEETPGPESNISITFNVDANADSTITNYVCINNDTLKIESDTQYCTGESGNYTPVCYWVNKIKYQNCAYGCYPGVVENGDYCSPPDYILWGFGLIVFFVAIFLINRYYRGR